VEHPVTEAITGLDLVELQFRIAAGEALPFRQEDITVTGHAVEARLYAEDPEKGFLPSTGKLWALRLPRGPGIRVDTGVREGDEVTPFYDPMIAKVIAYGASRVEALNRLSAALAATLIAGPSTNLAFLHNLSASAEFRAGPVDTGYIERRLDALLPPAGELDREAAAAGTLAIVRRQIERAAPDNPAAGKLADPWRTDDAFQLLGSRTMNVEVSVNGIRRTVPFAWTREGPELAPQTHGGDAAPAFTMIEAGEAVLVLRDGRQTRVELVDPFAVDIEHLDEGGTVKAPMHGKVVAVFVSAGERVEKGQRLAIVEAMKMEHVLLAPADGEVAQVAAEPGAQVEEGAALIVMKSTGED
jgi:3-methylcrotonyl-CoA carboxylase alpha subunit